MSDAPIKAVGTDRAVARALNSVAAAAPARPAQTPTREPAPADSVSLTSLAARQSPAPPVDAERVAQIKKAIANGTFPILPATIADRILALRYDWMSNDA